LTPSFVAKFAQTPPPFGFNGLGEFVYNTRYSRVLPDGSMEQWHQTVERVVNGTYNMQKRWIEQHELGWNPWRAQRSAQEMYRRIFHMKFLPPGRGLWAMGSPLTEERMLFASLNNCAFVSTEHVRVEGVRPFTFLMDAAMLGVGVGFDTAGAGTVNVKGTWRGRGREWAGGSATCVLSAAVTRACACPTPPPPVQASSKACRRCRMPWATRGRSGWSRCGCCSRRTCGAPLGRRLTTA
jgi:hypothetical protein